MLSHRNLVVGGESVSTYLDNTAEDRILAALPLSFDAGLSQMTTGFWVGAHVVLADYLLPRGTCRTCARSTRVTGLGACRRCGSSSQGPEWPSEAPAAMRYFANTGGHCPTFPCNDCAGFFRLRRHT